MKQLHTLYIEYLPSSRSIKKLEEKIGELNMDYKQFCEDWSTATGVNIMEQQ